MVSIAKKSELMMVEDMIPGTKETEESVNIEESQDSENKNVDKVKEVKAKAPKKDISIEEIPGVGAATAEKLKLSGFDNIMSIAVATPGEIINLVGVSEAGARKMINFARDNLNMGFISGLEVLKRRESVRKITTSCEVFDVLLVGGF